MQEHKMGGDPNVETRQLPMTIKIEVPESDLKDTTRRDALYGSCLKRAREELIKQAPRAFDLQFTPISYLALVEHFDTETQELLEEPRFYVRAEIILRFSIRELLLPHHRRNGHG